MKLKTPKVFLLRSSLLYSNRHETVRINFIHHQLYYLESGIGIIYVMVLFYRNKSVPDMKNSLLVFIETIAYTPRSVPREDLSRVRRLKENRFPLLC